MIHLLYVPFIKFLDIVRRAPRLEFAVIVRGWCQVSEGHMTPQQTRTKELCRVQSCVPPIPCQIFSRTLEAGTYYLAMMNLQTAGATLTNDSTCISGSEELRQSTQLNISSLPLETLLAIFASVCTDRYIAGYHHSVHVERCSLMSLVCICRLWYYIVMDAPEMWSDLQLCLPVPPTPECLLWLRNILERSKDRPMSIELSQSMTGEAAARRVAEGTARGGGLMVGSLLTPSSNERRRMACVIMFAYTRSGQARVRGA
ncbi:hypothetical protein CPB85DRAFT_539315 [Mucidula mucida]|nr:hypothetical protein CPB85DRAFT_539315 [Mucidula mucida]